QGLSPLAIANVVQNEAKKVCENLGVEYLKIQDVTNIKFKFVGLMNSHLIGESSIKADIIETVKFLTEKNYQNSETVMSALKIIRKFASHWNPRYMLLDQNSVKANGIEAAFPGSQAGEQKLTLDQMTHAMHKRTKAGCER
ncbi:16362_t:CDS:2, partial [Dentiscutata heterogama]